MERRTDFEKIKSIMGLNFIGPREIEKICLFLKLMPAQFYFNTIPHIPFTHDKLKEVAKTHVLFLGIPKHDDQSFITINSLRNIFGDNPTKSEPCFYNQDWYFNEKFANTSFSPGWYLISKALNPLTRGLNTKDVFLQTNLKSFPSAVLTTYLFFLYYFHSNSEILFKHDYVWNSDFDINNDRIYVGKYIDPLGINKNGFEIHRHLSIKPNYGAIEMVI